MSTRGAPSERDALVTRYADYARSLALQIARNLPRFVARDELVAAGRAGLVEAAQRFDPTRGVQFQTFAYYRVRGAVFDHVRRNANADPYYRARASAEDAVDALAEEALAQRPTGVADGPVAAVEALSRVFDAAATVFTIAECAEALLGGGDEPPPELQAERNEAAGALRTALARLPEKERALVEAVYFTGATIEEAGAALGLSKSWSSRLHARALSLLRDELGEHFAP